MEHPIKPSINSPHTEGWASDIGKLILNFAAIELHTYWWIKRLSGDEQLTLRALDWPFKKRVDHLLELLSGSTADNSLKVDCSLIWNQSLDLAKIRNAIAHNPLVYGWPSGIESGPPEVIGIPDVAHLGSKPRVSEPIASRAQINQHINHALAIARRLFDLLPLLDAQLRKSAAP